MPSMLLLLLLVARAAANCGAGQYLQPAPACTDQLGSQTCDDIYYAGLCLNNDHCSSCCYTCQNWNGCSRPTATCVTCPLNTTCPPEPSGTPIPNPSSTPLPTKNTATLEPVSTPIGIAAPASPPLNAGVAVQVVWNSGLMKLCVVFAAFAFVVF